MYVSEADPICALQVISFLKKCILKLATAFKHSKEFMTNVHQPLIPSIAIRDPRRDVCIQFFMKRK